MGIEKRGFASMTREQRYVLSSKGGVAAHKAGTAHEWTTDEARVAGRKGGLVSGNGRRKMVHARPDVGHDVPGGGANP